MGQEDLERAFALIQKGKLEGSEGKHWDAASSFLEARSLLQQLAEDYPSESEEEKKIRDLYLAQSGEYLHRSRASLIEAMQQESENDKTEKTVLCQALSTEDATQRIDLFTAIFSKSVETLVPVVATAPAPEEEPVDHDKMLKKQLSLEERLAELTASLPKGLKSDKERLDDLNQGMKRLGMVVTAHSNPIPKIEPPKSTSQQVEEIIAQAQDEVAMEVPDATKEDDNHDSGSISDDDDSLSNVDSLLSDEVPELRNASLIRDEIAAAQAQLAELQALLEDLPTGEEEEEIEGKPSPSPLDPIAGKQKLREAQRSLQKALKLWKVKAKPI
jgi:hypothetical protein